MSTETKFSRSRRAINESTFEHRHVVIHDYHDHSMIAPSFQMDLSDDEVSGALDSKKRNGPRGGVSVPFPMKLHVILSRVEADGLADVVSWQPHGRCFLIRKPKEFVEKVMPHYFRQSKLTSFQRQLNLYGFRRLTTGADRGGYYHELFLRYKMFLCQKLTRIRIKGTGIKGKASPETEPDFYSMPDILPDLNEVDQKLELEVISALKEESSHNSKASKRPKKRPKRMSISSYEVIPSKIQTSANPPAVVTPVPQRPKVQMSFLNSAEHLSDSFEAGQLTSSTCHLNYGLKQQMMSDSIPQLMRSNSMCSMISSRSANYYSNEMITFEGQSFHYLDSFTLYHSEESQNKFEHPPSTVLPQSLNSSTLSLPHLVSDLCDEDFIGNASVQSNAPGFFNSACSLHDIVEYPKEAIGIDPDFICSKYDNDPGWAIDIEAELSLMERNDQSVTYL